MESVTPCQVFSQTNSLGSISEPSSISSFKSESQCDIGLERISDRKRRSVVVARLMREYNARKGFRMEGCHNYIVTQRVDDISKLRLVHRCNIRLCPCCQYLRSRDFYRRVISVLEDERTFGLIPIFMTLTVRNCVAGDLRSTIERLHNAFGNVSKFRKLSHNNRRKSLFDKYFLGFFRSTEVTYNPEEDTYHPHLHVLVLAPANYFRCTILDHEELMTAWREALGIDYDPYVYIQKVKISNTKSVNEVVKYSVKSKDIRNSKVLECLDDSLRNMRLCAFGGLMKVIDGGRKSECKIKIMEGSEAADVICEMRSWNPWKRIYEFVRNMNLRAFIKKHGLEVIDDNDTEGFDDDSH